MIARVLRTPSILLFILLGTACGGSDGTGTDPDPDPDPDPVPAAVAVSPATDSLGVDDTVQLQATVTDAAGNELTGETVTWTSTDEGVATVSNSGLVTAVGDGSADVTATVGSLSDAADLRVFSGLEEVTDAGGSVAAGGGAAAGGATLEIPAGAVATSTPITASPTDAEAVAVGAIPGSGWELGPDGLTFSSPATLTLAYASDSLPAGADPTALVMVRSDGTSVERLTDVAVDPTAGTVQASVPGFSSFAICLPGPGALCGAEAAPAVDLVVEDVGTVVLSDDPLGQGTPISAPVALYQGKAVNVRNDGTGDATSVEIVFSTAGDLALTGLSLDFPEQGDPTEALMSCETTSTTPAGAVNAITCAVAQIPAGQDLWSVLGGEVVAFAVVPYGTTTLTVDVEATQAGGADETDPSDNLLGVDFPYYATPATDLVATLSAPAETPQGQPWMLNFAVENAADPQTGPEVDGLEALIQLDGVNFGAELPAGCGLDQELGSQAAVRCVFGNLPGGETREFAFELGTGQATEIAASAVLQEWRQVVDTVPANNAATSSTIVRGPISDVRGALTASAESLEVGGTVTYTTTVTNDGPEELQVGTAFILAQGPVEFPAGYTEPQGCSVSSTGVGISCGVVGLAVGEARTFQLAVVATGGGQIDASGGILDVGETTDPDPTNDIAELVTPVALPQVDLAFDLTRTPQELQGGQPAIFTFSVTNPAGVDAEGVLYGMNIVGDIAAAESWTLPPNCQLGGLSEPGVRIGLLCQASVPAGQTVSEDLTVDIGASETEIRVLGSIAGTGTVEDPNPANNEYDEFLAVTPVPLETDLAIAYALDPAPPVAGAAVAATVTVANLGGADAADVVWAMNFNNGVSLASGYTPPAGCVLGSPADPTVDGTGLLCSGVSVGAGGSASASIALVLADTASVLEITGDITDFGTVTDTNAANDGVSDQATVEPAPQDPLIVLDPDSVHFEGGPSGAIPDQFVQVLNGGGGTLAGLDVGVSYTTGSGWLTAAVGTNNSGPEIFLQANPSGLGAGTYRADVSVTDPQASNSPQVLPVVLEVLAEADLAVTLPVAPAEVGVGEVVEYQVSVTNNGPAPTSGASVRLTVNGSLASPGSGSIPAGCTLTSDAAPSSTYDCTLGGLASGGETSLVLPLVAQVAGEDLLATASIQEVTGATDPDAANDQAQATTSVTSPAGTDLEVVADVSPGLTAGTSATITFGVGNLGTGNASGVTAALGLVGQLDANAQWTVPAGCTVENDPLQVGAALSLVCGPDAVPAQSSSTRDVMIDLGETATDLRVVAEITSTGDATDDNLTNNSLDETLPVSPPQDPPLIGLSQDSVSFEALVDGSPPSPQTVFISNDGQGTLDGLDAAITYASGQPTGWLTASLQLQPAPGDPFLSLQVDQAGLALGTYSGTVTVTDPDASNSPQELPVVLHVLPEADISMAIANAPAAVDVGTTLTYQVTVTNNGPAPADRVLFQLFVAGTLVSPGASFTPDGCGLFTSPPGADPARLYQCTVDNLGAGQSVAFDLPLIPQVSGETLEAATAVPDLQGAVDPNPVNDVAQATTTVN